MRPPEECPVCGADVPGGAKACPECGSDEQTGWSEKARYDSLGVPDDEPFDYEEFTRREFGRGDPRPKPRKIWTIVAVLLLAALGFLLFAR